MSLPPKQQEIVWLRDTLERLRRNVESCAATIQLLSASLDRLEGKGGERETATPQSKSSLEDQAFVLVDDEYTTVVIQTVHGVRDTIKVPRRKL